MARARVERDARTCEPSLESHGMPTTRTPPWTHRPTAVIGRRRLAPPDTIPYAWFAEAAEGAKTSWPISNALRGNVAFALEAKLEG